LVFASGRDAKPATVQVKLAPASAIIIRLNK